MTIDFRKYVDITSSVGGSSSLADLELITRVFSGNNLIPTGGTSLEFTSAKAVGDYFGQSSEEYLRAVFYFSWISKQYLKAKKISYTKWAKTDSPARIFGARLTQSLTALKLITNGSFTLTLAGITHNVPALDFSGAADLAAIAALIQVGVRAADVSPYWASATVTYAATPGAFNFVAGDDAAAATISISAGTTGTNIASAIGWLASALTYPLAPVFSNGVLAESITLALTNSANLSTNFSSYVFTDELALTEEEVEESAQWNLLENNEYMFLQRVAPDDAATYATLLSLIGGTGLTLESPEGTSNEFPEMIPGIILAATDYTRANASQNFMFQKDFAVTPSVSDTASADAYDEIGINYYGLTQTNGQLLSFYQAGVLTGAGVSTNAVDMNTYSNEIWFKNANSLTLGNLLLAVSQLSANNQGVAQVIGAVQQVVDQAVINGVISVGTELNSAQIAAITEITNDPNAWQQVQNIGYWIGAVIEEYLVGEATRYKIVYTVVYKKNDAIRKIEGRDILI